MKKYILLFVVLTLVGCEKYAGSGMSREQQIAAYKECYQAGYQPHIVRFLGEPDGYILRVDCVPSIGERP